MADLTEPLLNEFGSLLDSVVILIICNDHDLADPKGFNAARAVLLELSKDVIPEEESGFNPSGLANEAIGSISSALDEPSEIRNQTDSDHKSNNGLTTTTESSFYQSLGSVISSKGSSSHDASEVFRVDTFDALTDEDKETQLLAMFTSLKMVDIKLALKKSKGDADLAIDELLNTELLEQTGQRLKGIDGFYTPDEQLAERKKKGKKKEKKKKKAVVRFTNSGTSGSSSSTSLADVPNDDEATRENIAYLAERLNQTEPEISNIYHLRGGSMGATTVEILDNYIKLGLQPSDRTLYTLPGAEELSTKYPWVPVEYVVPIFEITSPSLDFAVDLIQVLAGYFEKPAYLKYDIAYSVKAGKAADEELEDGFTTKTTPRVRSTIPIDNRTIAWGQATSLQEASNILSGLSASVNQSFASATSAFRRGKSDPLFRQAAGYYAETAREQMQNLRQARSIEAAYQVDSNSRSNSIDLHGLTVEDGVIIAVDRVRKWWKSLGEDRAQKAKAGFTVVTGLGRHSAGGVSRLRSSVIKALIADGWNGQILTGQYLVTGKRR